MSLFILRTLFYRIVGVEMRRFPPELQWIYTQVGLTNFLQGASNVFLYDIVEVMGSHLIAIPVAGNWVLLGPYVEEGWNGRAVRLLLTEHLDGAARIIKTIRVDQWGRRGALTFSDIYGKRICIIFSLIFSKVNRIMAMISV